MIRLGDVNFALGADTSRLQNSVQQLQNFGRQVERVQTITKSSAETTAAAFRKQEQAATAALDRVLRMNQQMSRVRGSSRFIDQTTAAFRQLNSELTRGQLSTLEYQRVMERFRATLGGVQREFRNYAAAAKTGANHSQKFAGLMHGLQSSAVLIQGPLGGIATRISNISSLFSSTGFAVAAFVAGMATAALVSYKLGRALVEAGRIMNSLKSQFKAVTGNTLEANTKLEQSVLIARKAGTNLVATAQGWARFSAAIKGTALEGEKGRKVFQQVSMASSVLQLSSEETAGVFKALEQMISKGVVQAEELRGQLGDRLPGAFNIAARAMGVSTQELGKMMKKGQVLSEDLLPKLGNELVKTFNLDNKPIDNYNTRLENLKTAWFKLKVELDDATGISTKTMGVMKSITSVMDKLSSSIAGIRASGGVVRVFEAEPSGFSDYIRQMYDDLVSFMAKNREATSSVKTDWMNAGEQLNSVNKKLGVQWDSGWGEMKISSDEVLAQIVDAVAKATNAIAILLAAMVDNFRADFHDMAGAINDFRKWISPWVDDISTAGQQPNQGLTWYNENLKITRKSWEEVTAEIKAANKEQNFVYDANNKIAQYLQNVRIQANTKRAIKDTGYLFGGIGDVTPEDIPPYIKPTPSKPAISDDAIKNAQKLAEALANVNQEIERTTLLNDAAYQGSAAVEKLNEQFAREDKVKQYADALIKAGASADLVKLKSQQLMLQLERKDLIDHAISGINEWADAWESAFDGVGNVIIDSVFEGKNALDELRDFAKQTAADILKSYWQLAVTNPLKNALFGTNESTLTGGFFGNIGKVFSGLFSGGGGGFSTANLLVAKGGVFSGGIEPIRRFAKGDVFSSPMTFPMAGGNSGIMSENGTEAIMPLTRDASGKLGVSSSGGSNGLSQIQVGLEPGLIASIVQQAAGHAVSVSSQNARDYTDSNEFKMKTIKLLRDAKRERLLG